MVASDQPKKLWGISLRAWIVSIILSVVAGLITFVITEKVKFTEGYEQGIAEGREQGAAEAREKAAKEFARLLEDSIEKGIQKQYPEKLKEARETGRLEGQNQGVAEEREAGFQEGYNEGYKKGRYDGEAHARQQATFESFFEAFSNRVEVLAKMAEYKELEEGKFKAQALAVYDAASHGRKALDTIAETINGVINQLKEEIDKGNIDAAKITAQRLFKSLETNRIRMKKALESLPQE